MLHLRGKASSRRGGAFIPPRWRACAETCALSLSLPPSPFLSPSQIHQSILLKYVLRCILEIGNKLNENTAQGECLSVGAVSLLPVL